MTAPPELPVIASRLSAQIDLPLTVSDVDGRGPILAGAGNASSPSS
jgi:hypothetical protein